METLEIAYKGLELEVYFEYTPEEAMVKYYYDGSGYPGCPAEIILGSVILVELEIDVLPLLTDRQKKEIECVVWERYGEGDYGI